MLKGWLSSKIKSVIIMLQGTDYHRHWAHVVAFLGKNSEH